MIHVTRARGTDDYIFYDLGNTGLAQRAVVSVPTSKLTATFQPVKADDEPRAQLKPRI